MVRVSVRVDESELRSKTREFRHSGIRHSELWLGLGLVLGLTSRNSVAKPESSDIRGSDISTENVGTPNVGTPAVGTPGGYHL